MSRFDHGRNFRCRSSFCSPVLKVVARRAEGFFSIWSFLPGVTAKTRTIRSRGASSSCRTLIIHAGSPGFTLMEIMVALAIVALLFTSLFAVFDQSMNVAEQVKNQSSMDQIARLILRQVANDLDSLYLPQSKDQDFGFQGQNPEPEFMVDNSTVLEFSTTAGLDFNATFPSQSLYRVSYVLSPRADSQPRQFRLLRSQVLLSGNGTVPETRTTLSLSKTVRSFQVEFVDPEQIEPAQSWNADDLIQETQPPPAEVRIRLSLFGPAGREQDFNLACSLKE